MAFTGASSALVHFSSPPTLPRPDNTVKNLAANPPRLETRSKQHPQHASVGDDWPDQCSICTKKDLPGNQDKDLVHFIDLVEPTPSCLGGVARPAGRGAAAPISLAGPAPGVGGAPPPVNTNQERASVSGIRREDVPQIYYSALPDRGPPGPRRGGCGLLSAPLR
ncbi:hypothetical protein V8F33_012630 [Rhypophila sp. PSN 637]